jgi:hypothetical protein
MARRSGSKVQSELYLALDRKYITETELKQAYDQADEAKRLINGLIAYLRKASQNPASKIADEPADYSVTPEELSDPDCLDTDNDDLDDTLPAH